MFYNLQEISMNVIMSCYMFPCHVRRGSLLEPAELNATLDGGHLYICHSLLMKYVYLTYRKNVKRFLFIVCMWYYTIESANVYNMYIIT